MPLLPPADAPVLRETKETVEDVRHGLDRVGRQRKVIAIPSAPAYPFLELLNVWFVEIQRVAQGVADVELRLDGVARRVQQRQSYQ